MIFLTIYLVGAIICWIAIAYINDEDDSNIPTFVAFLSWVLLIFGLVIVLFAFLFSEPSLKPIKNLYKRIFKQ